jgi:RNA polymerase sigma factor (sigma-70 family)
MQVARSFTQKLGNTEVYLKQLAFLQKSLEDLPDSQREILEMRFGQEKEFAEIASRLNMTSQNIRQQVSRAIRRLRKQAKDK